MVFWHLTITACSLAVLPLLTSTIDQAIRQNILCLLEFRHYGTDGQDSKRWWGCELTVKIELPVIYHRRARTNRNETKAVDYKQWPKNKSNVSKPSDGYFLPSSLSSAFISPLQNCLLPMSCIENVFLEGFPIVSG